MSRLIAVIKRFLTVCLAGFLVFFSAACTSDGLQAKTLDHTSMGNNPREEVPNRAITNRPEGGMNVYRDVDPRRDTSRADAKAKALVDNAERNLNQSIDTPEQYGRNYQSGTPLGERVRNLGEDISSSAQELTEGVAKGTQRGMENLKANTQNATKDVGNAASQAADNVGQNTKYAAKDAANKAQRAVEKTSDFVQDKANQAGRSAQRALD